MTARRVSRTAIGLGLVAVLGLGARVLTAQDEKDGPRFTETFGVEDGELVSSGKNPFFVLEPGYELVLEGKEKGKPARLVITVLDETRKFGKVETRVIEERETVDGELEEVSRNYFAISKRTNDVFYFGEDVDIYKDGKVTGHPGSWHHGEDGAHFGLALPGTPLLGARYYQEQAPKVAMDRCEIVSLTATVETPAGKLDSCLRVDETTPLEPDNKEFKLYARGIGLVQDDHLKLAKHGFKGEKKGENKKGEKDGKEGPF